MFEQANAALSGYGMPIAVLFSGVTGFLLGGASIAEAGVAVAVAIAVVAVFVAARQTRQRVTGGVA